MPVCSNETAASDAGGAASREIFSSLPGHNDDTDKLVEV